MHLDTEILDYYCMYVRSRSLRTSQKSQHAVMCISKWIYMYCKLLYFTNCWSCTKTCI